MRSTYVLPAILFSAATLVSTPFQVAQALSAIEVSEIAEAITVRIDSQNSGSGVLIKRQGNTYTVLTAAHVVATEDEYELVTADEQRYPISYNRVQKFPGVDLALVEFTSPKSYAVAEIGDSSSVKSGAPIYVSGFPIPTTAITEAIWNFSSGSVTANAKRALVDGYGIVYSNQTLPGMSGGAVLDAQGKLVGIHGRADAEQQIQKTQTVFVKTGFNLGIPINTFVTLAPKVNDSLGFVAKANLPLSAELTADDWYLSGGNQYKKGEYQRAIADYNKAIQLNPNLSEAYKDRGNALYQLGDKSGAIANYDKAIQLNPSAAHTYNNRGLLRYERGNRQGAIADYDKAIQLKLNDAKTYYNRGVLRGELGNPSGAIADYSQAIQLEPDFAFAYINRGLDRFNIGDKQGAFKDYSQAIQLKPNVPEAYMNRGAARKSLGDKQGAIADYTKAIQLNPDYAHAYFSRGHARSALNNNQGAIKDYKTAARLFQTQGKRADHEKALILIQLLSP